MSVKILCEIGINHNGDMNVVRKLIDVCSVAGVDYVKFQKRNPDKCVPENQKNVLKQTPWGDMRYIDYKYKIELTEKDYKEIDDYCKQKNIKWFASAWDLDSAKFLKEFNLNIIKIPSAKILDFELLRYCRLNFEKVLISTGMSTEEEIEQSIFEGDPDIIMHCNSAYPANIEDLKLEYIDHLKIKYLDKEIGYSGHEYGLVTTFAAVAIGVKWIERHITLDRSMWGSDQLASIEPTGLFKLVKGIRDIELAMGGFEDRKVLASELQKRNELRGL